ncbi:hypothetical protein P8452_68243 [Trifolium repens]|nr:hypothetical protein P8452_68243 [Trifolium repens]
MFSTYVLVLPWLVFREIKSELEERRIVQQYPFTDKKPMNWEEYISEIASDIMKEQSPKRLCHTDDCYIQFLYQ